MASKYWNESLGDLHKRVQAINYNHVPVTMRGNTLGAIQIGETRLVDGRWQAKCSQCDGHGVVDFRGAIDDPYRRGLRADEKKTCFRCNRKGFFLLPRPEHYLQLCWAWVLLRMHQEKTDEVYAMATSQRDYCLKSHYPWQKHVHDFWAEILRVDHPTEVSFLDEAWARRAKITFDRQVIRDEAFKVADSEIEFDIMVYMAQAMEKTNED